MDAGMLKEDGQGYYITRYGKEYTPDGLVEELGITMAAVKQRIDRYLNDEITLEQLFSPRVMSPVNCPLSGGVLLDVDPAEIHGQLYFELVRRVDCGRAHYANGMCKTCYYGLNPKSQERKDIYEASDAGRERRNRANARPETRAIKKFSTRKTRIAATIEAADLEKVAALTQRLERDAVNRFNVETEEASLLAAAAIAYFRKKNPDI